jgi:hypothetical protein
VNSLRIDPNALDRRDGVDRAIELAWGYAAQYKRTPRPANHPRPAWSSRGAKTGWRHLKYADVRKVGSAERIREVRLQIRGHEVNGCHAVYTGRIEAAMEQPEGF